MSEAVGCPVSLVSTASASVAIGHAALDAAIANYPDHRFMLRIGILVIRQYPRDEVR